MLPRTIIQANEGVDAVLLAEMQIAGSWTYAEQQMVRRQADKRRLNLIGGSNLSDERTVAKVRRARLKWIKEAFDELVGIFGDAMEADPDLVNLASRPQSGIPKRSVIRISEGERTAWGAFGLRNDNYISIRVPNSEDQYYGHLARRISTDTDLSMASLFCCLLELWDAAPPARRSLAVEKVRGRGVSLRKPQPMKESKGNG